MIKRLAILFFILWFIVPLHAETVYRWVDKDGEVHFSDKPHTGAKTIKLPPAQTYSPAPLPAAVSEDPEKKQIDEDRYDSIKITEPANESTSRDNQGRVPVSISLDPPLKKGDKVQVILDGKPMGEPAATTDFILEDVLRGSHTIDARVLTADGEEAIKTEDPTIIFMHRPRTGMTDTTPPPRQGP